MKRKMNLRCENPGAVMSHLSEDHPGAVMSHLSEDHDRDICHYLNNGDSSRGGLITVNLSRRLPTFIKVYLFPSLPKIIAHLSTFLRKMNK
jgi:hypothetical protein